MAPPISTPSPVCSGRTPDPPGRVPIRWRRAAVPGEGSSTIALARVPRRITVNCRRNARGSRIRCRVPPSRAGGETGDRVKAIDDPTGRESRACLMAFILRAREFEFSGSAVRRWYRRDCHEHQNRDESGSARMGLNWRGNSMTTRVGATARVAVVGLAVLFGSLGVTAAAAQTAEPAATEEEDDGFDWGWLGLLGLAGLAGLRRQEPEVHTTGTRR